MAEPFTKKGKLQEGRDEEPWGRRLILQERMPGNGLHDKQGLKSASVQREPSNGEPEATPKQAPMAVILFECTPCVYGQQVKY